MTDMSNGEQDLACCSQDEACAIVLSVDKPCEDLPYSGIGVGGSSCEFWRSYF